MNELLDVIKSIYNQAVESGDLDSQEVSFQEFLFEVKMELPLDISNQLV